MRIAFLTAALAATTLTAIPAGAQDTRREADREYRDQVRDARQDYRRDVRDADSRRDVRDARREYRDEVRDARQDRRGDLRDIRQDRRDDWRQYRNYDYNRLPRGQRAYFADNYYRDGRYYQPRQLGRNDRIYRGNNGRYYCRRNDGTTGLIVGGLAGGALGNVIAGGGSRLLGTLIGAGGGALLGQSVDRGNVVCR
ncbi:glycine zipper 2TM domain-containing protein [Sphingomonas sp. A2-49]|uniref:glycine zipper 2TM domain-containing protein n=1 Tax=Sphingomonas sp. A2-49 TaxID=1391375 RepID=UPI0021CE3348|nr:glycine zipper 2TM domain-containing protein [Sphingomonas sp. A2-49]MCU6455629.1 glycine zipper 2TM domain-containing protein [Sphingomonas sp. A2-49]